MDVHSGYLLRIPFGDYAAPIAESLTPYRPGFEDEILARSEADQNMRRLAACWNACEKVSTEDLEAMTREADLSWVLTIDMLVRERDRLRAELDELTQPLSDLHRRAVGVCLDAGHVSVATVHRRLRIGWNHARLVLIALLQRGVLDGLPLSPELHASASQAGEAAEPPKAP